MIPLLVDPKNSKGCLKCGAKIYVVKFDGFRGGTGHIGFPLGTFCLECRTLVISNNTIKVAFVGDASLDQVKITVLN